MATQPGDILTFWRDAGPKRWFDKNDGFDAAIRLKFEATHHAAARGEHDRWTLSADGALALLLLLDQFPRNLYRNTAQAFASDHLAHAIASRALELRHDQETEVSLRVFFYLPFEHAEDLADQDRAVVLMRTLPEVDYLSYAELHRELIRRFGRFPHRNAVLGRESTPEETAYLAGPGFKG